MIGRIPITAIAIRIVVDGRLTFAVDARLVLFARKLMLLLILFNTSWIV